MPLPRWPCRGTPVAARWRCRSSACAARTCWPASSPTRWPARRTWWASARFPITRWWPRPSTIACTTPWIAKAGWRCCGAWSAARWNWSPATCRRRRPWPRKSSARALMPSSTMRRWKSGVPRPCSNAAGATRNPPTTWARWTPRPSRRWPGKPGPRCGTPMKCTKRCWPWPASPRPKWRPIKAGAAGWRNWPRPAASPACTWMGSRPCGWRPSGCNSSAPCLRMPFSGRPLRRPRALPPNGPWRRRCWKWCAPGLAVSRR
ncbi:hypothetical protein D9M71_414170 [compost metagenome]